MNEYARGTTTRFLPRDALASPSGSLRHVHPLELAHVTDFANFYLHASPVKWAVVDWERTQSAPHKLTDH